MERLTKVTAGVVDRHTSNLRSALYSTLVQPGHQKPNKLRSITYNGVAKERHGARTKPHPLDGPLPLFQDIQQKRRTWTRTIEKVKTSRWERFLGEAGEGRLLKGKIRAKKKKKKETITVKSNSPARFICSTAVAT